MCLLGPATGELRQENQVRLEVETSLGNIPSPHRKKKWRKTWREGGMKDKRRDGRKGNKVGRVGGRQKQEKKKNQYKA